MIGESATTVPTQSKHDDASVLITVSTPGLETPVCRLGNSQQVLQDLTVRDLVERSINPRSLLSVGVPMAQLEAESPAALAIGELLSVDSAELFLLDDRGQRERKLSPTEPATSVANATTGQEGSTFVNIKLEVSAAADAAPPAGEERRQTGSTEVPELQPMDQPPPIKPVASTEDSLQASDPGLAADEPPATEAAEAEPQAPEEVQAPAKEIMTIVAEAPTETRPGWNKQRKEYVRKSDWLRAQFLPEVESLDFSGLFVGNLGLGIREQQTRRNVVLADPSRVTEVLLKGNGYRRSGDHAKALICYQELVDMDAANADFRFLLGKTLLELGQAAAAAEALSRAKELGHDGARKELEQLKAAGHRPDGPLGFLRFWK